MSSIRKIIRLICPLCLVGAIWFPSVACFSQDTNVASKVTIQELLTNKNEWKGKKVEVSGFFVSTFEARALYEKETDSDGTNDHKSLWIDFPNRAAIKSGKVKLVQRESVRIIGTFDFRSGGGCGHLGQWPAKLTDIELIEPVSSPK